ncbi:MAG TPA: hypothetical protein PK594_08905 [Mycobacterium sp.]|jgi:hypothetical protein|nr:hypothetical protein [Mycobacterium sp.]MCB9416454.1 hypothetical protein [Mycolicibacterium sp.]MCB0942995.1 hypothetical protein [Mycobacterium sp.]MCB0947555.1 hypothetical protein [Mycobacterium sp.]TXI43149.1 MAG: hypothetical protein E6Q57_13415 [Mycobacterium sp.]
MKEKAARLAGVAAAFAGCSVVAAGIGAGPAHAYTYGPFQWCPGDAMPNDPPRPDGQLNWDMSVCHTYYYAWDVFTHSAANYWEGPNLFPTPIPPPPGPPPGTPFCSPRGALIIIPPICDEIGVDWPPGSLANR